MPEPRMTMDSKDPQRIETALDAALESYPVAPLPERFMATTMARIAELSPSASAFEAARDSLVEPISPNRSARRPWRRPAGGGSLPARVPSAWEFALPIALVGALLLTLWQLTLVIPPSVSFDALWLADMQAQLIGTWSSWAGALMITPTALLVLLVGLVGLALATLPHGPTRNAHRG